MKLIQKEINILTYLEHGATEKYVVEELQGQFGYPEKEINSLLTGLIKRKMIDVIKLPEIGKTIYITSALVPKSVLSEKVRRDITLNL